MAVSTKQLKEMGILSGSPAVYEPSAVPHTIKSKADMVWKKDDRVNAKLMWELLPLDAVREIVKRFTYGAKHYGANNWRKCTEPERYIGALLRHLDAHVSGERMDGDTGMTHVSAVAWNALALVWLDLQEEK